MNAIVPRRSFLRGLVALPLVGGGVSLIGKPTAVAEPVTLELVEAYKTWLSAELSALTWQMSDARRVALLPHRLEFIDPVEQVLPFSVQAIKVHGETHQLGGRECGYDDAVGNAEDKVHELDVVAGQMRAIQAKTVQGLAIKARLTQFDVHLSRQSDMTAPEADWDWDVRCMEHFVREIERFAGLAAMGGANA